MTADEDDAPSAVVLVIMIGVGIVVAIVVATLIGDMLLDPFFTAEPSPLYEVYPDLYYSANNTTCACLVYLLKPLGLVALAFGLVGVVYGIMTGTDVGGEEP